MATKTEENSTGVQIMVDAARNINNEIGFYIEHYATENFDYSVKLTNGGLRISLETAQDAERGVLPSDKVKKVAATFRKRRA